MTNPYGYIKNAKYYIGNTCQTNCDYSNPFVSTKTKLQKNCPCGTSSIQCGGGFGGIIGGLSCSGSPRTDHPGRTCQ